MGIFNEHSTTHESIQGRSIRGPPGISFKIVDGNYDMQNKKLINVGDGNNDKTP